MLRLGLVIAYAGRTLAANLEVPGADRIQHEGLPPAECAAAITLAPGFRASLIAAEPDVVQPIAFAIDDRGRLWVAENHTYPARAPEGQGKDRILIFEDSDGDGRFETRRVFMEGLNLVCAIEVGFGGVWVGAAPYLMFIPLDSTGIKPAGPPQILLDGFGYQDTHNTLSTFVWGPDGWLYGGHGVASRSKVGPPGMPDKDRVRLDGCIWRYHPLKHVFEIFGEGLTNPWGIDFDDHGQCFATGCVLPHLWHVVQGGRYQRLFGEHVFQHTYGDIKQIGDHVHWAAGLTPHQANNRSSAQGGGHAHSGGMIYLGGAWPAEYQNQFFMFNLHGHRVNMDRLERRGSGYVGHHGSDLLLMNDKWSMVLNLQYGPDGAVYMIDWYDKQTCHNTIPELHDRSNGRIYRVTYDAADRAALRTARLPDLQKLSGADLVDLESNDNEWFARHGRRLLQERGPDPEVRRKLEALLASKISTPRRLRALWGLHVSRSLTEARLLQLFGDSDEHVRAWAIQLAFEDKRPSPELVRELERLASADDSPVVQLYVACALQRLPADQRTKAISALARRIDGRDHNLPLMVWFAAEPSVSVDFAFASRLIEQSKVGVLRQFTAQLVTPRQIDAVVAYLKASPNPSGQLDVLRGVSAALQGQRNLPAPSGWSDFETKALAGTNREVRLQTLALGLKFNSAVAPAALKTIVLDTNQSADSRREALDALLAARAPSMPIVLQQLLSDPFLRASALRGLAAYDEPEIPRAIIQAYSQLNADEKHEALSTLASRGTYATALVAALDANVIPVKALNAEIVRKLRSFKDTSINAKLDKLWGVARETNQQKQIEHYRGVWRLGYSQPGDASRGRALFQRNCQPCHVLFDVGGKVGPDLTGANRDSIDYLLQNIVDPNALIPNEYQAWLVETTDDRAIIGLLTHQDDQAVTMLTSTETLIVPRKEIRTLRHSELSLMPEGLLAPLTDQEVRDLLYYLTRPGQVPLPKS